MTTSFPLIDSSYSISRIKNYELSIQLKLNGFSFFIYDAIAAKWVYANDILLPEKVDIPHKLSNEYYCQFLYDALLASFPFETNFRAIRILFHQPEVMLVPQALANPTGHELLFMLQFPDLNDGFVEENLLQNMDAKLVFALSDCLYRMLQNQFPGAKLYHALFPLISLANRYPKKSDSYHFFLDIQSGVFHLAVWQGNEFLLAQSQIFKTFDECLYQLASIRSVYADDAKKFHLLYSGDGFSYSDWTSWANSYFDTLSWWPNPETGTLSATLTELNPLRYNLLMSLKSCES